MGEGQKTPAHQQLYLIQLKCTHIKADTQLLQPIHLRERLAKNTLHMYSLPTCVSQRPQGQCENVEA